VIKRVPTHQAVMTRARSEKPRTEFGAAARSKEPRTEKIRQEVKQKYGILDIGVPAIRELRDA
jgi:hypothetical protein